MFRPIIAEQCGCSKECTNNRCFFRLRDCFGYPPFWYPGNEVDINKALEKAGVDDMIFPKFQAFVGTNVIYVNCENQEGLEY